MKRRPVPFIILLALISQPALATQTACVFSAGKAPRYYELEFIGYTDKDPTIVFTSTVVGPGKRFTLNQTNYTLQRFSQKARAINLEYRDRKNSALPPSFTLTGTGGRAKLSIGSTTIVGDLNCDF